MVVGFWPEMENDGGGLVRKWSPKLEDSRRWKTAGTGRRPVVGFLPKMENERWPKMENEGGRLVRGGRQWEENG
jgi:hypothetical protein